MRYRVGVVAASLVGLAACAEPPLAPCTGVVREGELHVVIDPPHGYFGAGYMVSLGDTMHLTAEVRPALGASVDFWGGGGCKVDYGAPLAAVIEWSSSNNLVASVSATGVVSGHTLGDARITARNPERNISAWRDIGVW